MANTGGTSQIISRIPFTGKVVESKVFCKRLLAHEMKKVLKRKMYN